MCSHWRFRCCCCRCWCRSWWQRRSLCCCCYGFLISIKGFENVGSFHRPQFVAEKYFSTHRPKDLFVSPSNWVQNFCSKNSPQIWSDWKLEATFQRKGCRHSSVDLSVPTILLPGFESQAHHPCFYHLQYLRYICHVKRTKIKQKEAGLGPFKKHFKDLSFVKSTNILKTVTFVEKSSAIWRSEIKSSTDIW